MLPWVKLAGTISTSRNKGWGMSGTAFNAPPNMRGRPKICDLYRVAFYDPVHAASIVHARRSNVVLFLAVMSLTRAKKY